MELRLVKAQGLQDKADAFLLILLNERNVVFVVELHHLRGHFFVPFFLKAEIKRRDQRTDAIHISKFINADQAEQHKGNRADKRKQLAKAQNPPNTGEKARHPLVQTK